MSEEGCRSYSQQTRSKDSTRLSNRDVFTSSRGPWGLLGGNGPWNRAVECGSFDCGVRLNGVRTVSRPMQEARLNRGVGDLLVSACGTSPLLRHPLSLGRTIPQLTCLFYDLYGTHKMTSAITDENTPDLGIDETPISPVDRRNSLEKHLERRPTTQELKDRNILLNSNAAP